MRLLADECIEKSVVEYLRVNKFNVDAVSELNPGASDITVIDLANNRDCILLTADKDFGELIFRQGKISKGVILVRLHGLSKERKSYLIAQTIREHQNQLTNSFTVIESTQIRISRMKI